MAPLEAGGLSVLSALGLGPCSWHSMEAVCKILWARCGPGPDTISKKLLSRTLITPQALRAVELASRLHPSSFFLVFSPWALSA